MPVMNDYEATAAIRSFLGAWKTKYIFPKQMQSVAALVFIAVLIVLLLILTVMVHMRNRKLKSTLEEQMAERRLLDKICADFTAV